jgi:hypothetical protein
MGPRSKRSGMRRYFVLQWNLYITDTLVQDTFVHYSEVSFIGSVGVADDVIRPMTS